jgi:hypothetical protein
MKTVFFRSMLKPKAVVNDFWQAKKLGKPWSQHIMLLLDHHRVSCALSRYDHDGLVPAGCLVGLFFNSNIAASKGTRGMHIKDCMTINQSCWR